MSTRSLRADRTLAAAISLIVASLLAACGSTSHTPSSSGTATGQLISFGDTTCAPNWRPAAAGRAQFRVSNASDKSATVYLFRSDSGAVLVTLHGLRPGITKAVTAHLKPGVGYSWACDLAGHPDHLSDSEPAPRAGQPVGSSNVAPVYVATLIPALDAYRSYVARKLRMLKAQARMLVTASHSGNLAQARSIWLAAHLTWLRIGQDDGAYGAFGDLGQQIDGIAAGLVGATASRNFTGFHRIEHDLWDRRPELDRGATDARRLTRLIGELTSQKLSAEIPATKAGMTTFTIRAHEVLEDALRDTLSADDDYGSGTALASLTADLAATREFLRLLAPDIDPRAPDLLAQASRQLRAVSRAIAAGHPGADWTSIRRLSERERQRLDESVGDALQTLSRVPDLLALGGT